jgi:hypothetical protein
MPHSIKERIIMEVQIKGKDILQIKVLGVD